MEAAKQNQAMDIIQLLELFEQKISFTEIISTPIPILNELRDAKIRFNEERAKEAEKAAKEAMKKREQNEQVLKAKQKSMENKVRRNKK